jgi:hypothetical protein
MLSPKQFGTLALLLGLILAGCSSVGTQQSSQTTQTTMGEVTTTVETRPDTENNTDKTPSCRVERPKYEVTVPEEPGVLNETTVKRFAIEYEKRYQRARHETVYNLSYYEASVAQVNVENTEDGFEVTVKIRVEAETSEGTELSGGYPHTYEFTDDEIDRDREKLIYLGD